MSAPVGISVTERTEGTRRVLEADGWEWVTSKDFGDDEPRISDEALAPKLGLVLRKLRELSGRHERAGNIAPRKVSPTVGETGGRPACQRWYTEADALFLVTRSERAEAIALTKAMIQVVIAVRRHLLSTVAVAAHGRRPPQRTPSPPPAPAGFVPSAYVLDMAQWTARMTRDTPESVMHAALVEWAKSVQDQRDRGYGPAVPKALPGAGRWLLVTVSDGIYEVLERQAYTLGFTPTPSLVAASASRALQGLSILVDALTAVPREAMR